MLLVVAIGILCVSVYVYAFSYTFRGQSELDAVLAFFRREVGVRGSRKVADSRRCECFMTITQCY